MRKTNVHTRTSAFDGGPGDERLNGLFDLSLLRKVNLKPVIFALLAIFSFSSSHAQAIPTGDYTVGPGGDYATITAAVTDINAKGLAGNVTLRLIAGYGNTGDGSNNEPKFPIRMPKSSAVGSYTVTILPNLSGIIIGNVVGDTAKSRYTGIINFDSSNNIIIDGRVGGFGTTNDLVINDTSTTTTAGDGYAVSFKNGSSNNTIRYCNLQGRANSTSSGVVQFLTSNSGLTGNNNNTISNCNITSGSTVVPINGTSASGYASGGSATPFRGIFSLGTAGQANTGNTVSNCNIYDIFNAGGAAASISLSTNNTGWTITGNSIYQTSSKTVTAAAASSHSGIAVSDGGGYTITNNFVGGGASGASGSMWDYTGTGLVRLVGLNLTFTTGSAVSSIQGNVIRKISQNDGYNATPMFVGIYVLNGDANIGTTTGNVIGDSTANGAILITHGLSGASTYGIYCNPNAAATYNVQNNTISGITTAAAGGASTIAANIQAINVTGPLTVYNVSNNLIGSETVTNSLYCSNAAATTSQTLYGISIQESSTGAANPAVMPIQNNRLKNLTNNGTSVVITGTVGSGTETYAGSTTRGMFIQQAYVPNITGNTIAKLTSFTSNPALTGGLAGIAIFSAGAFWNANVTDNVITGLYGMNTGAVQTNVIGVLCQNINLFNVLRNRIYDFKNLSTQTSTTNQPTAAGIVQRNMATTGTLNIFNNMITLGQGQTSNTQFMGIWSSLNVSGGQMNVYYNSVLIGGTVTSGSLNSYGYQRSSSSGSAGANSISNNFANNNPVVDFKNNIFINQRTGGTGGHYALGNFTSTPATNWNSNYNLLTGGTASTVVRWYTTAPVSYSMTQYKTTGFDANSITGSTVNFVNPAVGDLHINVSAATELESAGTTTSAVTTDIDGQSRPMAPSPGKVGGLSPDLGADEFDGDVYDVTPPAIAFTPITNTSFTGTRSLVNFATITDNLGVEGTAGLRPRIYYKRSTDANTFVDNTSATNGWKYDEANNASSPFTFNLDFSRLFGGSGVAQGTTVQYFVVAQDIANPVNIGINSGSTFATAPTSVNLAAANFPIGGTIKSFSIVPALSGTISVGSGQTITSLTNVGGLFDKINNGALLGHLIVNITSDLTAETGAVSLRQFVEDGAGNYTVTIRPTGAARTISGTVNDNAMIRLVGADRVTIDGSKGGGGTDRSLTIKNSGLTNTGDAAVIMIANATTTDGATYNTIKNCVIVGVGSANSQTQAGIAGSDSSDIYNSASAPNSYNTIQNNSISAVQYGILFQAPAAGDVGNAFIGNSIGSSVSAGKVGYGGIYAYLQKNATIADNKISGVSFPDAANEVQGIVVISTTNTSIVRNKINDVTNTAGGGAEGIYVSVNIIPANDTIANNMITGVYTTSSTTTSPANTTGNPKNAIGLFIRQGAGYYIYYNAINMYNATSTTGLSAAMYVHTNSTTANSLDIRNNIFANTWAGSNRYAFYSDAAATIYSNLNYNDYWAPTGSVGYITTGARSTFAAWQSATGKEANGKGADPLFNSASVLAPQTGSPVLNAGTPVTVTNDIIKATRSGSTPSMGAYETPGDFNPPVITYTKLPNTCDASGRQLYVTITDLSGVNTTSALLPRLYYKKNSGNFVSSQGTLVSGTATNGTWRFSLYPTAIGGVVAGDVVSYYVAAQDVSVNTNIGSSPAGVDATDVNTIVTAPPTNTYSIQTTLAAGTYTVGTGGNYPTLTAAVNAYNNSCLGGPIVFSLTGSSYSAANGETFPINIVENTSASPTNTLTIKPASGNTATITGGSGNAFVMIFDGADYVTIDGSNNGSTSRNLSIVGAATTTGTGVLRFNSYGAGDGAKFNTIKNCNITGGSKGTGVAATTPVVTYGMYFGDNLGSVQGPDNDNITIDNNVITKVGVGVQAGANSGGVLDYWKVTNNTFGDAATATNSISRTGFSINNAKNLTVTGNKFLNLNVTDLGSVTGLSLGTNVTVATIARNFFTGIKYTGTGSFGARAIDIATDDPASAITVHTNAISDVSGAGNSNFTTEAVSGIRIGGTTGGVKLYFNTVHLGAGTFAGNAAGTSSAALYVGASVTGLDIRSNIFSTTLNNSAASAARTYAIYSDAPSSAFTTINNNAYSAAGAQGIAGFIGSARTTLAAIQAGFGQNAGSIVTTAAFTSATDLHPAATGNCALDSRGVAVGGVTTDLDNTTRGSVPDAGAYEFTNTGDNSWVGVVSSSWQTAGNWCSNSVPTVASDIVISAGTPFSPKLNGNAAVRNITWNSGSRVTLSDYELTVAGTLSGSGIFAGTKFSKLKFTGNGAIGTLTLKSDSASLYDLSLTGTGASLILGSATNIVNSLNIGGNTLNTGGFLTIKSDINGTGSVGPVTGTISGQVAVERYIPKNGFRAWRLLSVPVQGTETFHTGWQENQAAMANGNPGYGTLITGPSGTGLDANTTGYSLLKFQSGTPGSWVGITNTGDQMQTLGGYMLYVRGDRSAQPVGGTMYNITPTTLRVKGNLYTGNVAVPVAGGGANTVVGNIYASAVDFDLLTKSGVSAFKVWDPKLQGTSNAGAFQTFSSNTGYDPVPGGGSYGSTPNSRIESGQAFLVSSSSGGSITFTESAKVTGSKNVFRTPFVIRQFKTNLYAETASGPQLADGNAVVFDNKYTASVDNDDESKAANIGEDLAIVREGQKLVIETRPALTSDVVINYNMSRVKQGNYTFEFVPKNIDIYGAEAYLVDNYLKTRSAISIAEDTKVTFTVNTDPASAAADRFRVEFKGRGTTPITAVPAEANAKSTVSIYPNPVVDGNMNLALKGLAEGKYTVRVTDKSGSAVYSTVISHSGEESLRAVKLPAGLATGAYQVEILGAAKRLTQNIVVSNK